LKQLNFSKGQYLLHQVVLEITKKGSFEFFKKSFVLRELENGGLEIKIRLGLIFLIASKFSKYSFSQIELVPFQ